MTVTVYQGDKMNPLEMMLVEDHMRSKNPGVSYTMAPGNDCIWVYWGSSVPMNLYYIFRDGRIADIQVD